MEIYYLLKCYNFRLLYFVRQIAEELKFTFFIQNYVFDELTGKDMSMYYNSLRENNQFENRQQLLVSVAQLNEKGFRLIQSVRKRINDYLVREVEEPKQLHEKEGRKFTKRIVSPGSLTKFRRIRTIQSATSSAVSNT